MNNQGASRQRTSIFRFKQFEVDQRDCAMKINTDGVLLGATAELPELEGAGARQAQILDIGTGTGVIALMLAQRFPSAGIDAIEVEPQAAARAAMNFQRSPFADRLCAYEVSLEEFQPDPALKRYDLMVSNPPFYTNALHNPDPRKRLARHTDFDFFRTLLDRAQRCLLPGGHLQLILPPKLALAVAEHARLVEEMGVVAWRDVFSFSDDQEPVRVLLTMQVGAGAVSNETAIFEPRDGNPLIIYEAKGRYSDAYRALLRAFFLKF